MATYGTHRTTRRITRTYLRGLVMANLGPADFPDEEYEELENYPEWWEDGYDTSDALDRLLDDNQEYSEDWWEDK